MFRRWQRAASMSLALAAVGRVQMQCQRGGLFTATPSQLQQTPGQQQPSSQTSATDEDREELERERQLRERFAQKVQQAIPNAGGEQGAGPNPFANGVPPPFGAPSPSGSRAFRFFFFFTALLFLMVVAPMTNADSPMRRLQGIAWWQLPISTGSYYLLLRALYPRRDHERIKEEYEQASRENPALTFDQFMAARYPSLFQGYRTSQAEVVAAVAACLATSKDAKFARSMQRAVGRNRDPKASVDAIMDALRRDFPQLF